MRVTFSYISYIFPTCRATMCHCRLQLELIGKGIFTRESSGSSRKSSLYFRATCRFNSAKANRWWLKKKRFQPCDKQAARRTCNKTNLHRTFSYNTGLHSNFTTGLPGPVHSFCNWDEKCIFPSFCTDL